MGLTSFAFFAFLFVVLFIYFIVPKKLQWMVLLLSSVFFLFYDNFEWKTLIYVLIVLLTAYVTGLLIDKFPGKKKSKLFLAAGIIIILSELVYLKYTNFILITIKHIVNLFGGDYNFEYVYRNSPIGVSYYSLIMISYIVDIYRGLCKPQKNIFKCALFMSYFPILTSGPFVRYKDMKDQIYAKHKFDFDDFCHGLLRILWGLFKILVISQRLSLFVTTVFNNYTVYNGFYIVIAAMFFTLQLYTNFSGSIDMIMGVSKILRIELPENFRSPFFSPTITELWRNWHITLGAWLKDYVFYPLMKSSFIQKIGKISKKLFGKKISKKIMLYISMLIMWILIGAWHNGAYTFIISSGILQFIYMFLEDILSPISAKINKKLGIKTDVFSYKLYQCIRTFLLFSFAMIFFNSPSVGEALKIIKNMFVWNPWVLFDNKSIYQVGLDLLDFRVLIISLIVLFIVERMQMKGSVSDRIFNQNIVFRWGIIYLLFFSIVIFGLYGPGYDATVFIYRQF